MPLVHHLPPPDLDEDQSAEDHPIKDQSPPTMHIEEPQIPVGTASTITAPLPASFAPPVPPAPSDSVGPSTLAPPLQHISISPWDFLAIMDVVRTFEVASASFVTAYTALTERLARVEVAATQTTVLLAQNHAILMLIHSHLGLTPISPPVPAQASSIHPPIEPETATYLAPPTTSLDLLAAATVADTPLVSSAALQPTQDEDDIPPVAHH